MTTPRFSFAVLLASLLGAAAQVQGQNPPPAQTKPVPAQTKKAPRSGEVEADPIRCWWKADRSAIRVG
jgi:hypothetical protein